MGPYRRNYDDRTRSSGSSNGFSFDAVRRHRSEPYQERPTPRHIYSVDEKPYPRRPTPRNLRNSPGRPKSTQYQASMKKNPQLMAISKKAVALALSAAVAIGGAAGYGVSTVQNAIAQNETYSLNQYDSEALLSSTDQLIKQVLKDNSEMPEDYRKIDKIISYTEPTSSNKNNLLLTHFSYFDNESMQEKEDTMPSYLPTDFAEYVYKNYKKLNTLEQNTPEEDKNKVSYWLKVNTAVNDLTNGLTEYANRAQDKEYGKSAESILNNSSKNTSDISRDDGDER